MSSRFPLPLLLAGLVAIAACKDSTEPGTDDGPTAATVSGVVKAAVTKLPIAGATVTIGGQHTETGANGQFELTGVATGALTIRCEHPRYQTQQASLTVPAGGITRDFELAVQEIYEFGSNAIYVPADVGTVRAVIIALGGPTATGFVTGGPLTPKVLDPIVEQSQQTLGSLLRTLARSRHVALLGSSTTSMSNNASSDQRLLAALDSAATLSGHPELASAPVVMLGMSGGGPEASGLAARNPARTVGVFVRVPDALSLLTAPEALAVPAFVLQAGDDVAATNAATRQVFVTNRKNGGRWALIAEPGRQHFGSSPIGNTMTLDWITAVLDLRLPAAAGGELLSLAQSSGWLGSQASLEIASWDDYVGDRTAASWLPTEATAREWQALGTPSGSSTE
jgi:hypothetical protein